MEIVCSIAEGLRIAGPYAAAGFLGWVLLRTAAERREHRAELHAKLLDASRSQAVAIEKVECALTSFHQSVHAHRTTK